MTALQISEYISDFNAVNALHSKRSPRLDDMRALQARGLQLLDADADMAPLIPPLATAALALNDSEALLSLFERALDRSVMPANSDLSLLLKGMDPLLAASASGPLTDRAGALRTRLQAYPLHSGIALRLATIGKGQAEVIRLLQSVPADTRTPEQTAMLAEGLLQQAAADESGGALAEAIAFIDDNLPLLETRSEYVRILMTLSILISTRALYLAHAGLPDTAMAAAISRAERLDDSLRQPLGTLETLLRAGGPTGSGKRFRRAWVAINADACWRYEFADAATLRVRLLEEVMDGLEAGETDGVPGNSVGLRLFRCVGQCEDFWVRPDWRAAILKRYDLLTHHIDEPRRTVVRGMCHLANGEQAAANDAFVQRRGPEYNAVFNGSGHVTFLPSSVAETCLSGPVRDPSLLPEACDFSFVKPVDKNNGSILTLACADPGYLAKYYESYTQSLFKRDPQARAHFHLMGDVAAVAPAVMEAILAEPRVSLSAETAPIKAPYYYATARFLRAPQFMAATSGDLLLTDMDIKFMEAPSALAESWRRHGTIGMRLYDKVRSFSNLGKIALRTPRIETWGTLNASCLYLANAEDARRFADYLSRVSNYALGTFRDSGNSNWWIDQNVIFAALRAAIDRQDKLAIFNLLDVGIPFGAIRVNEKAVLPARGQHPALPLI